MKTPLPQHGEPSEKTFNLSLLTVIQHCLICCRRATSRTGTESTAASELVNLWAWRHPTAEGQRHVAAGGLRLESNDATGILPD